MACSGHLHPPSLVAACPPQEVWASLYEATMCGLIWRLIWVKLRCFSLLPTAASIGDSLYSKTTRLLDGS